MSDEAEQRLRDAEHLRALRDKEWQDPGFNPRTCKRMRGERVRGWQSDPVSRIGWPPLDGGRLFCYYIRIRKARDRT